MTRTDRGTGAAEVPDPGRGKARGPKNPPRRAAAGGAGCGAAVRLGCWVRPALLGLPVEQRQTAEAGVTAAAGGVTGATSSTGTRCGGPGLPIGTTLAVCVRVG